MHHHMISSHMIPSLWHTIPFVGLILTLALLSASASSLWHRFEKAILACWVLLGLFSMHTLFSYDVSFYLLVETLFLHYLPFIGLILTLFIISCSIEITVYKQPTPLVNVLFLMIASVCASFIGTTGASILFIRPFLKLNEARIYKTHLVIFFILIVSNIAGSLTPLGDPPLFMGYLQGVPFFWPLKNLFLPFVFTISFLFGLFFFIDTLLFKKEEVVLMIKDAFDQSGISFQGKFHLLMLGCLIGFLAFSESLPLYVFKTYLGVTFHMRDILFMAVMLTLSTLSLMRYHMVNETKTKAEQKKIDFSPFFEVARVFLCIFITLIPVNYMISLGNQGPFKEIITLLNQANSPQKAYFWITGFFSSILDNAPTYLVFFNLAGGNAQSLIVNQPLILQAISLGSVFMGALTYIGNAPNLMVYSFAKKMGIQMPSFLSYTAIALCILIPIFLALMWIFL